MTLGTPHSSSATRVLLLGSGELGKEVAIELQRFGCEVIACDRYADAPAMQVAHRSHVFSMLDGAELRRVVEAERPDLIVPEIEAIATDVLLALEAEGQRVVPTARAAHPGRPRAAPLADGDFVQPAPLVGDEAGADLDHDAPGITQHTGVHI